MKNKFANERVFEISLICTILGSIIRIAHCIINPVQPRDSFGYKVLIEEWENSGSLSQGLSYFPFSIWILKLPYHFFKCDIVKSAVIVNIVLGLIIIIAIARIAFNLTKQYYASFLAGLIAATHPSLVEYSCYLLRENSYLVFCLLSIVFGLLYFKKKTYSAIICGGIAGSLTLMCRLEGLEIFFLWLIVIFFLLFKKEIKLLRSITHFGLFLLSYVITSLIVCSFIHFTSLNLNIIAQKLHLIH